MEAAEGRDRQIAEDYLTHSAASLVIKYRLSLPHIKRILSAQGVKKEKGPVLSNADKVIDENHRLIGIKLYFHRCTIKSHSTQQASEETEWSIKKLRNIEQGFTELTLNDLITIAGYLGITLPKLMETI